MFRAVGQRPVLAVLVAAVGISFSGILFRLSHVSSSTGAFYRCVWALPPLFVLARIEDRRYGKRETRAVLLAWLAGVFFAADLILWHNAIELVGAGLATVLGNTQVVLVALLAWALLGERPQRSSLAAIPAYAGFLLTLRQGSKDLRRPAGPLFTATLSAAIFCAAIGAVIGDLDLTPSLSATGWLVVLALSSQVISWLLISSSLPRLPAVVTSILLTLQPVLSVIFAALIIDESPSKLQLAGAGCILAGLIVATVGRRQVQSPEPELAG